ncbi:MAG: hypothetical protein LUQ71_10220 [Methanoregula sp.]|nr:hypothetical protein [Methanoregula sp.]
MSRYVAVVGDKETLNDIPDHGDGTYPLVASTDRIVVKGKSVVLVGDPFPAHCANASAAAATGGSDRITVGGVAVARIGDHSTHPVHTCLGIFGDSQTVLTIVE